MNSNEQFPRFNTWIVTLDSGPCIISEPRKAAPPRASTFCQQNHTAQLQVHATTTSQIFFVSLKDGAAASIKSLRCAEATSPNRIVCGSLSKTPQHSLTKPQLESQICLPTWCIHVPHTWRSNVMVRRNIRTKRHPTSLTKFKNTQG